MSKVLEWVACKKCNAGISRIRAMKTKKNRLHCTACGHKWNGRIA